MGEKIQGSSIATKSLIDNNGNIYHIKTGSTCCMNLAECPSSFSGGRTNKDLFFFLITFLLNYLELYPPNQWTQSYDRKVRMRGMEGKGQGNNYNYLGVLQQDTTTSFDLCSQPHLLRQDLVVVIIFGSFGGAGNM